MAGNNSDTEKLEKHISCLKYTIFCFNVITWIVGAVLFGLAIWVAVQPNFQDWVDHLDIQNYNIGVYILLAAGTLVMIFSFMGCGSALTESQLILYIYIILQFVSFGLILAGSAVLLDYSTMDSQIQPLVRGVMLRLINDPFNQTAVETLRLVQEGVGCCGADGPRDYLNLQKPLPSECRDSVTGNAYFYGCVQEITWYVEEKSSWMAGLGLLLCLIHVINGVLSLVFVQAIKKEADMER